MPLHQLRGMPLADLQLYERYTRRRGFPARRVELLLAQVALVLAQVNGNKETRLADFLMDPPPDPDPTEEPEEPDAEAVARHFGFNPRNKTRNRNNTHGE